MRSDPTDKMDPDRCYIALEEKHPRAEPQISLLF